MFLQINIFFHLPVPVESDQWQAFTAYPWTNSAEDWMTTRPFTILLKEARCKDVKPLPAWYGAAQDGTVLEGWSEIRPLPE